MVKREWEYDVEHIERERDAERYETKCVYFAHPQATYNTPAESECERGIEKVFDMCIVNPRDFAGNYDAAVANSDAVVFIDDCGILGKGTVSNISLARSLKIPVYYYKDAVFYQDGTIRLINGGGSWSHYAKVVTKGEVYRSLKPRLMWLDKLNAKLLQWRQRLERKVGQYQ